MNSAIGLFGISCIKFEA
uniref:Uncharacterized protein n=1 Tax=Anguilla anguilla TaxID=7936 RepID=A0A0E9VEA5_ANGAN